MDSNTGKESNGADSQRENIATKKDSARGNQSKSSKQKVPPPAFAYRSVARQKKQMITEGVLGARSASKPASAAQGSELVDQRLPNSTFEEQKLIYGKNPFKDGTLKKSIDDSIPTKKSSIDHSSLFIHNSPRGQSLATRSINAGVELSYAVQAPQLNVNWLGQQYPYERPQLHSSVVSESQTRAVANDSNMQPVFVPKPTQEIDDNVEESKTYHELLQKRTRPSLKSQQRQVRNDFQIGADTQLQSMVETRTGTVTDLIAAGSSGEKARKPTSFVVSGFKNVSGNYSQNVITQQDQTSTHSGNYNDRNSQMNSNQNLKVDVLEKSQNILGSKRKSQENSTFANKNSLVAKAIQGPGEIELQQELNIGKDEYKYSQYANPFNVRSFHNASGNKESPRKDGISQNGALRTRVEAASETEERTDVQERNPTKVEVYKVTDFLNSERQRHQMRIPIQASQQKNVTDQKTQENFIKNILKQPKVTDYQLLKRPKTNRESISRAVDNVLSNSFMLHSQRDIPTVMKGVVSKDQDVKVKRNTTSPHNPGEQKIQIVNNRTVHQTQFVISQNSTAAGQHNHKFSSFGSSSQDPATNPTTPNRVSKTFAGGFGGAGSVYTHSHLTNTRKRSHYRTNTGIYTTAAKANNKHTIVTQQEKVMKSTINSNEDLIVAGIASSGGIPDYLFQQTQRTLQNSKQNDGLPLSNDTSRSPIPIDPETYKNLHRNLKHHTGISNMDLPPYQSRSRSRDPSQEKSIESNCSNSNDNRFTQIKPFIMSPQNLQEQLKHQQEAIRAGHQQKKTSNDKCKINNPILTRNSLTQNGKRAKIPQHKLNTNATRDQGVTSQVGLSVDASQVLTARRFISTDTFNSNSNVIQFEDREQRHQIGGVFKNGLHFLPPLEGKKIAQKEVMQVNREQLLSKQNDEFSELQDLAIKSDKRVNSRPDLVSDDSLIEAEKPSDVAIRVNKVNIAIGTETKVNKAVGQSQAGRSIDSREQINFSGLTNYQRNIQPPQPIFDQDGKIIDYTMVSGVGEPSQQINSQPIIKIQTREFKPVLKSKSYIAKDKNGSNSPSNGSPSPADLDSADVLQTGNTQGNSPKDDRSKGSLLEERLNVNYKKDFKEVNVLSGDSIIDWSKAQQLTLNQQDHANESRSRIDADAASCESKLVPTYDRVRGSRDIILKLQTARDQKKDETDYGKNQDCISSDGTISQQQVMKMLKFDEKAWAQSRPKDFGALDFVALKTHEFLVVQQKLGKMDHNSLNSDRKVQVENRTDLIMKDIALSAKKHYNRMGSADGKDLYDINQRKTIAIKNPIPTNMIKFKNKSEQKRYVRIANCILTLNDSHLQKSQNDIEFTYMKIFRFLSDMLTEHEFNCLSYYHVSRFIGSILKLAFEERDMKAAAEEVLNPITLRQFVFQALDMRYKETQQSHDILFRAQFDLLQKPQIQPVWSKVNKKMDLNKVFSENLAKYQRKLTFLEGNAEVRHHQIQDRITNQVYSFAHQPSLQAVIRGTFFKNKETINRQTLARLLKQNKNQNDLNYDNLSKESTIARNNIVLEHVVASRNMREWKDQCLSEIHQELRNEDLKRTKSQTGTRRTTRLY